MAAVLLDAQAGGIGEDCRSSAAAPVPLVILVLVIVTGEEQAHPVVGAEAQCGQAPRAVLTQGDHHVVLLLPHVGHGGVVVHEQDAEARRLVGGQVVPDPGQLAGVGPGIGGGAGAGGIAPALQLPLPGYRVEHPRQPGVELLHLAVGLRPVEGVGRGVVVVPVVEGIVERAVGGGEPVQPVVQGVVVAVVVARLYEHRHLQGLQFLVAPAVLVLVLGGGRARPVPSVVRRPLLREIALTEDGIPGQDQEVGGEEVDRLHGLLQVTGVVDLPVGPGRPLEPRHAVLHVVHVHVRPLDHPVILLPVPDDADGVGLGIRAGHAVRGHLHGQVVEVGHGLRGHADGHPVYIVDAPPRAGGPAEAGPEFHRLHLQTIDAGGIGVGAGDAGLPTPHVQGQGRGGGVPAEVELQGEGLALPDHLGIAEGGIDEAVDAGRDRRLRRRPAGRDQQQSQGQRQYRRRGGARSARRSLACSHADPLSGTFIIPHCLRPHPRTSPPRFVPVPGYHACK